MTEKLIHVNSSETISTDFHEILQTLFFQRIPTQGFRQEYLSGGGSKGVGVWGGKNQIFKF